MEQVYFIAAIVSFVLAAASLAACIIIFFKLRVADAIRFFRRGSAALAGKGAGSGADPRRRRRAGGKGKAGGAAAEDVRVTPSGRAVPRASDATTAEPAPRRTGVPSELPTDLLDEGAARRGSEAPTDQLPDDELAGAVEPSEAPTSLISDDIEASEAPTGLLAEDAEPSEAPTGLLAEDIEESEAPTGLLVDEEPSEAPTGLLVDEEEASEAPTGLLVEDEPSEAPTGLLVEEDVEPSEAPTGLLVEERPNDQAGSRASAGDMPSAAESEQETPASAVEGVAQQEESTFRFILKSKTVDIHTDETIDEGF